jgi:16S rRNA (uracil1498-N3)-methyltransferase
MPDRYFSDEPLTGNSVTLRGSEAHHLLHVMRAAPGTEVLVFDGRGGQWLGAVSGLRRAEMEITLLEHQPVERELAQPLTLAVALPKGDRQRWLVEKSVELGVTHWIPLTTARSAQATAEPSAKLMRYVIEASKQCGRNRLMQITPSQSWADLVSSQTAGLRLVAHPGGSADSYVIQQNPQPVCIAIGPEGGFTDSEIDLARSAGWQVMDLGERILRIETAALVAVARWATG